MTQDNRRPLLLFSGGQDSTYMLQDQLLKGNVYTLYVTGGQHPDKVVKEKEARKKIIRRLEMRTGNRVLEDYQIDVGTHFGSMHDSAFKQPIMWLNGALMVSNAQIHSELMIAYVAGDQVNPHVGDIGAAWNELQKFSKASGQIPLRFPHIYLRKNEVMRFLFPEVAQYTWVCEMPGNVKGQLRPCGGKTYGCEACKTLKAQLYMWKETEGRDYWRSKLDEYRAWQSNNPILAATIEDAMQKLEKENKHPCELICANPNDI